MDASQIKTIGTATHQSIIFWFYSDKSHPKDVSKCFTQSEKELAGLLEPARCDSDQEKLPCQKKPRADPDFRGATHWPPTGVALKLVPYLTLPLLSQK